MEDNIAKKQLNRTKSTAQVLIVIICAIIAASIISGAAFDVTRISGRSMDDTLYGGKSVGLYDDAEYNSSHFDVIRQDTAFDVLFFGRQDTLGDKALLLRTKKARRGDIVVFMHESGGKTEQWIKRVIGVSGDTVRISDGKVYLNGKELDESYALGNTFPRGVTDEWTVGDGEMFVLGDNRAVSQDSRDIGVVKTQSMVGRVILVAKKTRKSLFPQRNFNPTKLDIFKLIPTYIFVRRNFLRAGRCSVFNMKRILPRRNDIIRYFCDLVILMLFENAEAAGGLRPLGLAVFSALVFSRRNVVLLAPMYLAACLLKDFSYVGLVVAVTPVVLFIAAYFVYHKLNRPMHRTTALIVTLLSCVPRVAFAMVNGEIYAPILSSVITLVAAYVLMTALNAVAVRGLRYRLTVDERISLIVAVGMLSLSLFTIKIRNFNLLYPFFAFCLMLSAYAFQGVQGALVTGLSVALGASLQGGSSGVFAVIMITAGVAAAFKNLPEAACAFALTVAFTFSLFFLDTFSGYGYVNAISIFVGAFSYVLVPRKYKTMLSSSGISYTAVGNPSSTKPSGNVDTAVFACRCF